MNEDTFSIVCSFLTPVVLTRVSRLSRWHHQQVDTYLRRTVGTTQLEDLVCPYCGDWISQKNILLWDGFFNCTEAEAKRVNVFIEDGVFPGKNTIRHNFLCEDCEYYEREEDELERMPYAGSRRYNIFTHLAYVSLIYVIRDDYVLWNEIRMIN